MALRYFLGLKNRLQEERISAFREYIADVKSGEFPAKGNLIEMDETVFEKIRNELG